MSVANGYCPLSVAHSIVAQEHNYDNVPQRSIFALNCVASLRISLDFSLSCVCFAVATVHPSIGFKVQS